MIHHVGHHHHYHKPTEAYPTYELKVKRTDNSHWHDSPTTLEHTGNAIFGGPCICELTIWDEDRTITKHTSWAKIKEAALNKRRRQ